MLHNSQNVNPNTIRRWAKAPSLSLEKLCPGPASRRKGPLPTRSDLSLKSVLNRYEIELVCEVLDRLNSGHWTPATLRAAAESPGVVRRRNGPHKVMEDAFRAARE